MGIVSKDKKTKKTGPKGKKARRQAKLDNRWGETAEVDNETGEEIKKTTRRGHGNKYEALKGDVNRKLAQHSNEGRDGFYHRLQKAQDDKLLHELTKTKGLNSSKEKRLRVVQYDDQSSTSDSDDDSDLGNEEDDKEMDFEMGQQNPMSNLLSVIRTENAMNGVEVDSDEERESDSDRDSDDDSDSEDDSEDDSKSDEEEMIVDDSDKENSSKDAGDNGAPPIRNSGIDFFRKRFCRPPLNKSELSQLEGPQSKKPIIKKIAGGKHVELQYIMPLLNDPNNNSSGEDDSANSTICGELLSLENPQAWQASAREAYLNGTREVLQRYWLRGKQKKSTGDDAILSEDQAPIYSFLARYADVFDTTSATGKGSKNSKNDRQTKKDQHRLHILHVLNHILTSRARIGRNNRYLKEKEAAEEIESDEEEEKQKQNNKGTIPKTIKASLEDTTNLEERDVRDQGFTRPSVLVLLPTRGTCHKFVKDLYKLSGAPIDPEQEDRFDADYGELIEEDDEDDEMDADPKKAAQKKARRKVVLDSKGKEWNDLFGDNANKDDDFKIGISLIPKTVNKKGKNKSSSSSNVSIRLYSDFFKSDIIVASPLGLKILLTPNGGDGGEDDQDSMDGNTDKKGNCDYLSSIEICLLQHSEVILMQNWDHVNDILSLLNKDPLSNNGTDFSRVRNYLLDGQGARWRQLILSSKFWDPALLSTFKRFGKSLSGQVKVRRKIRDLDASITRVLVPTKQIFQKVPTGTFAQQSKARVDYFINKLWPQLQQNDQKHTLVFIPSYFDFCSVRNALLKLEQKYNFVSVTEYSRGTEINRGRARFLQGRKPLMLYTGRAHYFHRHAIKGVYNLVILGLPEHPEFYADCVNLIKTDDDDMEDRETSCLALFTKYEAHALERIVGSSNAARMINSSSSVFTFKS